MLTDMHVRTPPTHAAGMCAPTDMAHADTRARVAVAMYACACTCMLMPMHITHLPVYPLLGRAKAHVRTSSTRIIMHMSMPMYMNMPS